MLIAYILIGILAVIVAAFFFINRKKITDNANQLKETKEKNDAQFLVINKIIVDNEKELKKQVKEEGKKCQKYTDEQSGKVSTDCHSYADEQKAILSKTFEEKAESLSADLEEKTKKCLEYTDSQTKETAKFVENKVSLLTEFIDEGNKNCIDYTDEQNATVVKALEDRINALTDLVDSLSTENNSLKTQLSDVNKKLNFYANIEEDSTELNVKEDTEERARLLELAKQQILSTRKGSTSRIVGTEQTAIREQLKQGFVKEKSSDEVYLESVKDKKTKQPEPDNIDEDVIGMLLDSEQLLASNCMENTNRNIFITGKAGTGKSFLLDVFRETTEKKHIVIAPTGIAALNVNGVTIHSVFGYDNLEKLNVEDINTETVKLSADKSLLLRSIDMVVIDEISMVRADTFDKIDRILRVVNGVNAPFGGKQMIIFGDLFQLPPIAKYDEKRYLLDRYGGIYFFNSDAYADGDFQFIELSVNHRQKDDKKFFELLNRIREGKMTKSDLETLNQRVAYDETIYDRFITLLPTKAEAEKVNSAHMYQLESQEFSYQAEIVKSTKSSRNKNLENSFPIMNELKLRKGALVMMVANDPGGNWVNGTLGIVQKLTQDSIFVSIDGKTYEIHKKAFKENEVLYTDGKIEYKEILEISQFPIVPAYAITIHKSQGQTYKNIVCDIGGCFTQGQAYVALSRCESLEGLHLKKRINPGDIMVDGDVLEFYQRQTNK